MIRELQSAGTLLYFNFIYIKNLPVFLFSIKAHITRIGGNHFFGETTSFFFQENLFFKKNIFRKEIDGTAF